MTKGRLNIFNNQNLNKAKSCEYTRYDFCKLALIILKQENFLKNEFIMHLKTD